MKVVVLATAGAHTDTMVNFLDDAGVSPVAVLVEPGQSRRAMLRFRARRLGWSAVLGQLFFMVIVPPLLRKTSGERLTFIRETNSLRSDPLPDGRMTQIPSVNAAETRNLLRALNPDAVVLSGTRIVKSETLEVTSAPVLNIHAGITPTFRGVHGGYWALWTGQPQDFGATVHCVDRGVDTGAVLDHVRPMPGAKDNFVTYPLLQLAAALPALVKVLQHVAVSQGLPSQTSTSGAGRQWYHPTLMQYLSGFARGVK